MNYVVDEPTGTITVPASTLAELVVRAAEGVNGARVRRGRRRFEVEVADRTARVRLELVARYGLVLPELARRVQDEVASALATMCAVRIVSVDVSVEEVE
jgi:uncharacterized alkaline shock family protein YloU